MSKRLYLLVCESPCCHVLFACVGLSVAVTALFLPWSSFTPPLPTHFIKAFGLMTVSLSSGISSTGTLLSNTLIPLISLPCETTSLFGLALVLHSLGTALLAVALLVVLPLLAMLIAIPHRLSPRIRQVFGYLLVSLHSASFALFVAAVSQIAWLPRCFTQDFALHALSFLTCATSPSPSPCSTLLGYLPLSSDPATTVQSWGPSVGWLSALAAAALGLACLFTALVSISYIRNHKIDAFNDLSRQRTSPSLRRSRGSYERVPIS